MQSRTDRQAERLVVARLDRLGRNAEKVLNLDTLASAKGWGITLCDLDTANGPGWFQLTIFAATAELERNLIAHRTRVALAAKKARGERLGRPQTLGDVVVSRVIRERAAGATLQARRHRT